MEKRFHRQLMWGLALLLLTGCQGNGVLENVHVRVVRPENVVSLNPDTLCCAIPEDLMAQCYDIRIISDSIIVLQKYTTEENGYFFEAFSMNTFQYIGSFAREGRGPEEILDPILVGTNSVEPNMNFHINGSLEDAFAIDVAKTLYSGQINIVHRYCLPSGIVNWAPLAELKSFIIVSESGQLCYRTIDCDGKVLDTFLYREEIDNNGYVTFLSSLFVRNEKTGKVAEIMLFLPQINLFDTSAGEVMSVAVNTDFRKWRRNSKLGINYYVEYFEEAAASSEFIIATYKGMSFENRNKGCQGKSIQVFDWDGGFKCAIHVNEDIGKMAFDSKNKCLYCIERDSNRLIRYNLSCLI